MLITSHSYKIFGTDWHGLKKIPCNKANVQESQENLYHVSCPLPLPIHDFDKYNLRCHKQEETDVFVTQKFILSRLLEMTRFSRTHTCRCPLHVKVKAGFRRIFGLDLACFFTITVDASTLHPFNKGGFSVVLVSNLGG